MLKLCPSEKTYQREEGRGGEVRCSENGYGLESTTDREERILHEHHWEQVRHYLWLTGG